MGVIGKWYHNAQGFRAAGLRRAMRFAGRRVGHRGAVLLFLVVLDMVYGYSLITEPPQVHYPGLILPLPAWGWVWIGTGIVLFTGIVTRNDKFHFGLASLLKACWASAWLYAEIYSHTPRAWVSVVIWASFGALMMVISFWPEPRKSHTDTTDPRGFRAVGKSERTDE